MELSKELQEIASMSLVHVRKKSFCADTLLLAQELSDTHLNQISEDATLTDAINSESVTTNDTCDSDYNTEPLHVDVISDESSEPGDDHSDGGSSDQLSLSPGIISPFSKTSLLVVEETNNCGTWPRHRHNRKTSTVRFNEDPDMVRQKEMRSRLAAASSSDWTDMTGYITDSGYADDEGSPFKTVATPSTSIEDELVIPDWRIETPIPVLGDESMDWKERESKIEDALEWIRTEIRDMKKQDQILMCQFIQLRSDIHQLKCTGLKQKKRHQGNSKISGSCSDIIKSPNTVGSSAPLSKFQSSMALNYQDSSYSGLAEPGAGFISEEELDVDDDVESERTLLEPEYLPMYRNRTMSLLPTAMASPVHRKIAHNSKKYRNMSFSAGSAENTERGLSELVE